MNYEMVIGLEVHAPPDEGGVFPVQIDFIRSAERKGV